MNSCNFSLTSYRPTPELDPSLYGLSASDGTNFDLTGWFGTLLNCFTIVSLSYIFGYKTNDESSWHVNKGPCNLNQKHFQGVTPLLPWSVFWAHLFLCKSTYIILDGFEGDTRIYCTSYDNIALFEDECNIVIASAMCIPPPKKAIQYWYYYLY